MVLKSFFRNKVIKVYLTIITVLLIAISCLFASNYYLDKIASEEYQKSSLVYIENDTDIFDKLKSNNDITNLKEVIKFDYFDELIDKYYIFEYEVNESILVYVDKDNEYNLRDDEVIISIFGNKLSDQEKERFKKYINQEIDFLYNNQGINLKIKNIEFNNHGHIIISENLFSKLKKEEKKNSYTISFISEEKANNHNSFWDKEIELSSTDDLAISKKIKENKNYVQYASYVCIFIFVIIIIVVNKNIISDLKNNMNMEIKLGYTNTQIKINILKRLCLFHLLSYIISLVISIITITIANIVLNSQITYNYTINITILAGIILLSDLLLSLVVKTNN